MGNWCLHHYRYCCILLFLISMYIHVCIYMYVCTKSLIHSFTHSLQAWNGAGLSAIYSSLGHTHDSTPPSPGIVHDTLSHDSSSDADHTPSLFEISASWAGFSDPHSHIVQYHWAIGTCDSCYDVQDFLSVGVATGELRFLSVV